MPVDDEVDKGKKPHPDSQYIMQDNIGVVIANGLSVVYKKKPENPVDFFAKWLLRQSEIQKHEAEEKAKEQMVLDLKDQELKHQAQLKKAEEERKEQKKQLEDKKDAFHKKILASDDLNKELPLLADHLEFFTGSTAVYIGKVVKPIKGISNGLPEDADEWAHVIETAKPHIKFMHATNDHREFLVDKILEQEQGITYRLFKEEEKKPESAKKAEEGKEEPVDKTPKHIFISEVVKEPRMHYYRVPRLGSYLAIKLEYESCMFEGAFDDAIEDYF